MEDKFENHKFGEMVINMGEKAVKQTTSKEGGIWDVTQKRSLMDM